MVQVRKLNEAKETLTTVDGYKLYKDDNGVYLIDAPSGRVGKAYYPDMIVSEDNKVTIDLSDLIDSRPFPSDEAYDLAKVLNKSAEACEGLQDYINNDAKEV